MKNQIVKEIVTGLVVCLLISASAYMMIFNLEIIPGLLQEYFPK